MDGLLMIERRPTAKIATFDQGDAQSAACRIVGGGETVNAAADHQQVELVQLEAREIAAAHGSALSYSRVTCHHRALLPMPRSASTGTGTFTISKSRRTRSDRG